MHSVFRNLFGFTLIEIISTTAIVLILLALLFTGWHAMTRRIMKLNCLTNMRAIHAALGTSLTDLGHWPQRIESVEDDTASYEAWWIQQLKPYGITEKQWQCPVLARFQAEDASGYILRMHYIPTDFDANPISPRRWSTMPWLIEQGNNHGKGALVAFPDGSIRNSLDMW